MASSEFEEQVADLAVTQILQGAGFHAVRGLLETDCKSVASIPNSKSPPSESMESSE